MNKNQKIGTALILGGIGVTFYGLFIDGKNFLTAQEKPTYSEPEKPEILLNDDRNIYQGNPNDPTDFIRGYDMPSDINKLVPVNSKVFIATKPNVTAFGQGGRSAFDVTVDFANRKLSFKGNDNKTYSENYDSVKNKIVITDKKYIKQ
jgi:hypothetical protein